MIYNICFTIYVKDDRKVINAGLCSIGLCPPFFSLWVTDHRRNCLLFSMNGQDLFSAQKYDSSAHPLIISFDFSYLTSQVKDGH